MFCIYPLYTLPFIVNSMLKNHYFGYFLFALLMGILGYLMIPYDVWDLTRHYEDYNSISSLSIDDVFTHGHIRYLPLHLYFWVLSSFGLPQEALPLISLFFAYLLQLLIIKNIFDCGLDFRVKPFTRTQVKIIILLLYIGTIPFVAIASSLRQFLASSIYIYALYFFIKNNKHIPFVFLSFMASLVHISIIPLMLVALFSSYLKVEKYYRMILFIATFLIVTNGSYYIFSSIFEYLKPVLISFDLYFVTYMDLDSINSGNNSLSVTEYILKKIISPSVFYLSILYLLLIKINALEGNVLISKCINRRIRSHLTSMLLFISLIAISPDMFARYQSIFVSLFIILLAIELTLSKLSFKKFYFLIGFIMLVVIVNVAHMNAYKFIFIPSWLKLLYMPLPFALLESVDISEYIKT